MFRTVRPTSYPAANGHSQVVIARHLMDSQGKIWLVPDSTTTSKHNNNNNHSLLHS